MNVLIVFAHPERQSLNGALLDVSIAELKSQGHTVQVSDLYAMNWKATVDGTDFPIYPENEPLHVPAASRESFVQNALTADVKAEQEKLLWADTVILQFPLWWFAMPAILKGWVDRVYACGFAYGVGEHNESRWGDRYGEGTLVGKRAMLTVTAGGWPEHYGDRGVNGQIENLLFPINHGILYYPGFTVLPPFVAYRADRLDQNGFTNLASQYRERLKTLSSIEPIAYRQQNGGDYTIPTMELREGLETPGTSGFDIHIK